MTVTEILDAIKELKLLEVAELVKAMEEEFGVSAAAPVAVQPREAPVALAVALRSGLGVLRARERFAGAVEGLLFAARPALAALLAGLAGSHLQTPTGALLDAVQKVCAGQSSADASSHSSPSRWGLYLHTPPRVALQ